MFIKLIGAIGAGHDPSTVRVAPGAIAAGVLSRIAVAAGRAVPIDDLIDALWDEPPVSAKNAVQVGVSRLRSLVGRDLVETVGGGYRLGTPLARVDVLEVEEYVSAARRFARMPRWPDALAACDAALALEQGVPLSAVRSTWGDAWRDRLAELFFEASLLRADALVAHARSEEAATLLAALSASRPLDERAPTALMRILAALGRPSDALALYDRLRRRLADELGTDPAPQTQALFAELLDPQPVTRVAPVVVVRLPRLAGPTWGREETIATLGADLDSGHRLVTIVGPGGIGKTRLAIAAARAVSERTHCSAWFIDLTAAAGSPDVEALLDASIDPGGAGRAGILARGSHLVVLDNAEHLVDAVARAVGDLLAAGDVRVLVTSRTPLKAVDERTLWLGELECDGPDSPAARMMVARAESWLLPTVADVGTLAILAARVDGVPLALELLAAALRWRSPAQLLADVDAELRRAALTDRRPERHSNVAAAIAWNIDAASSAARRALGALGVFRGDFSLAAAEDVLRSLDPPIHPLGVLSELVDLSLVRRLSGAGDVRLRILEPIRITVAEHPLVGARPSAADGGFARHYMRLVTTAVDTVSGSDAQLLDLYRRDDHHVARAISWLWRNDRESASDVIGHVLYYWYATMREGLIEEWEDRSSQLADEPSAAAGRRAVALFSWYVAKGSADRIDAVREMVLRRLPLLDRVWTLRWIKSEASRLLRAGRLDEAEEVRRNGPAPETPNDLASQAVFDSLVASSRGDYGAALEGQERALRDGLWDQMPTGRFYLFSNAGYFAVVVGEFERAQWLLARAKVVAVATGLRDELVMTHVNIAWMHLAKQEWPEALDSAAAAASTLGNDDDADTAAEIVLLAALASQRCAPDLRDLFISALRAAVGDDPSEWFDPWSAAQALTLLEGGSGQPPRALSVPDLADLLNSAAQQVTNG